MFYILNNNVEDVSVGGIFNLLDFIFNEYYLLYLENVKRKESITELLNYHKKKKLKNWAKFKNLSQKHNLKRKLTRLQARRRRRESQLKIPNLLRLSHKQKLVKRKHQKRMQKWRLEIRRKRRRNCVEKRQMNANVKSNYLIKSWQNNKLWGFPKQVAPSTQTNNSSPWSKVNVLLTLPSS